MRFNPCFIGTYSFTGGSKMKFNIKEQSFNPCFIGTYSFTFVLNPNNSQISLF